MKTKNPIEQNINIKHIRIASIGFDWRSLSQKDPELVLKKLARDNFMTEENNFLLFFYSSTNYYRTYKKSQFIQKRIARSVVYCHVRACFEFARVILVSNFKPDLLVVSDVGFLPAALIAKFFVHAPVFLALNNMPTELAKTRPLHRLRLGYYVLMEKIFLRFVDGVYTINETLKKYVVERGVSAKRVFIFTPNTIARDREYIEKTQPGTARNQIGIPKDAKIILSVGRIEREKGFDRLLNIFSELKDKNIFLVILGEGSLREELRGLITKKGLENRVILLGEVSREDIWGFYRDANAFMLLSYSEGLGLVFWEAMYSGLPVIGSAVGGINETIGQDGDRGFFWKENIIRLEEELDHIFRNTDQIVAMKQRAREYVLEKMRKQGNINEAFDQIKK